MNLLLISLGVICIAACFSLLTCKKPYLATFLGAGGAVAGCVIGLIPAVKVLIIETNESVRYIWEMPFGSFYMEIDPLSAFFLIPIFGLSAVAAIYGGQYLMKYRKTRWLGVSWFFYNILVASMVMVVVSRNAVLFLIAWEVMALSSFFLVAFENDKDDVRKSSWTYMVSTYLGTVFLVPMFVIFGLKTGSLDFSGFFNALSPEMSNLCFILALIGFGTKAGIAPFHVWLPEAHPAAPSHVSALMSGVMIKTGVYGIVRIMTFISEPPLWWGYLLLAAGVLSGVAGVLFAIAKHDFKRILAYSSVENIGIIFIGLGVGVIGWSGHNSLMIVLGFGGAFFHVINHAMFKGLLFLGAGSVYQSTHTREANQLGGLLKRMPYTGVCFLIGSAAISGLPPLNGFIGEFLIFMGSFQGILTMKSESAIVLLGAIGGLALIGGLAAACFTRAFGMVFLGEPRHESSRSAHESGIFMKISMIILAAGCVVTSLASPLLIQKLSLVVAGIFRINIEGSKEIVSVSQYLLYICGSSAVLITLSLILIGVRHMLLSNRTVGQTVTWDCGYAAPSARMQYTPSSFSEPINEVFKIFLRTKKSFEMENKFFPAPGQLKTYTPDVGREQVYKPVFTEIGNLFSKLHFLQQGRIQFYVLYLVITLLVLLFWNMG